MSVRDVARTASFSKGKCAKNHFNQTEIQDLILSSNECIPYLIKFVDFETKRLVLHYLRKTLSGNSEQLLDFFKKPIGIKSFLLEKYFDEINFQQKEQLPGYHNEFTNSS